MAKLSAQVAKAAKAVEATVALSGQIETLKQQIANEWVEFALKAAGAHDAWAAPSGTTTKRPRANGQPQ